MAAGIGSMNWWYRRNNDIDTNVLPPNNVSAYIDAGEGWSRYQYRNFNAAYQRFDDDGNNITGSIQPYERHNEANQPVGVGSAYVRYDENNVIVPNPGNNVPNDGP